MTKVKELLEKDHLQGLLLHWKRQFLGLTIELHSKRMSAHVRKICSILQEFFHVRLVVADQFDAASGETFRVIDMYGITENVSVGEYCYHFLEERLDHFWRRQRGGFRGQTRIEKKIFYFGLLIGFGERLAVESQPR